jgi:cephalosporin hydroxylase
LIKIDLENATVAVDGADGQGVYPLDSQDAFRVISKAWLRAGWDTKYVYGFTWMGRPIIQLPEDLIRVQEAIYEVQPDVILETGIAHGGSLIFYASLLKAMDKGRVIGIDVEIRPHNRLAIEAHPLAPWITMIEGSSIEPSVVEQARALIRPGEKVLVMLDANHTKAHVLAELQAYAGLVSVGSWIVAADGIMEEVAGAPRTGADWTWNNPKAAALEFVSTRDDFRIELPAIPFNEGVITEPVTYWQGAWIRRVK